MTTQSVTVACPGRPPPTAQLAVPGSGALGAGFRGRKRPGFIRACGLEGTRPGPEEQLARRGYGRGVGAREGTGSQGSGHRAGWGRARGSQCASFPTGPASPLPACPTRSSSEGQCPQALSGSQAQAQSPAGPLPGLALCRGFLGPSVPRTQPAVWPALRPSPPPAPSGHTR